MKQKLSLYAYILSATLIVVTSFFYYPKWNKTGSEATISWDASGYYWYLPAFVIYPRPKSLPFSGPIVEKYAPSPLFDQVFQHKKSGNWVMKYSSGLALQNLPLFLVAHVLAKPLGFEADGFSRPYQFAVQFGGVLMALIGFWYLRKVLKLFFEDTTVAIVLLLYAFCTNYLNYSAIDCAMTHSWLFSWYVILIWHTHHFYQMPTKLRALAIGAICGLMALTRPSDVIAILIPLFWGISSLRFEDILAHVLFIKNNFSKYAIASLAMICVGSIQLMYWKYVTDEWVVYSYQDQGFSWLHPHFKDYLFSYRSGWLLYTPLMIFAYIGILPLLTTFSKRANLSLEKTPNFAILLFIFINTYIVCAWDIWWFGGRAMVQSYPVLAFPLAALVAYVQEKNILKYLTFSLFGLCFYYNIWWIHGSHRGGMFDPFNMTRGYLYHTLGDWTEQREKRILFDTNEWFSGVPQNIQTVYNNDFEQDTTARIVEKKRKLQLSPDSQYSPNYTFSFAGNGAKWLRASANFTTTYREWDVWKMTQFAVQFRQGETIVKENVIRPIRLIDKNNETKNVAFDIKMCKKPFDNICIRFGNPNSEKTVFIDDVKVETHD